MNQKIRFSLLLLSVILAWGYKSQAQVPDDIRQFEFQTLLLAEFDSSHARPLYYQQGADYFPASFSLLNLGLKHTFRGAGPFKFYQKVETPEGDVMQAVAELEGVPPEADQLFLVVLPGQEGTLKMRAIQVDAASLKPGELLLLNYSDKVLALSVGAGDVTQIMPGKTGKIPYVIEAGKFSFVLKVAAKNEGGWRMVHSRMVTQVDRAPLFVIAFKDAIRSDQWQLRFLRAPRAR